MSTETALILVLVTAAVTFVIKAIGPVVLGGRELPPRFTAFVGLLAPALFAALLVTQVLAHGQELGVGADTAGVGVAALALWRGASMPLAVVVAAVVTALLRLAF